LADESQEIFREKVKL